MAYTREGHIIGTVPYMSPEQAQGRKVDDRSDIFSFGCVLYEMVTGCRPFTSDSAAGILAAIIRDEPTPVKEIVPAAPVNLVKTIERALQKQPEKRYASMIELHRELREIQGDLSTKHPISSVVLADTRKKLRKSLLLRIVALGFILMGIVYLARNIMKPPPPPIELLPLTTMEGYETDPALSPDGKQVAFSWNGSDGRLLPHLRPTRERRAAASNSPMLPGTMAVPRGLPTGVRSLFNVVARRILKYIKSPPLAGPATRLATTSLPEISTAELGVDWSPDGRTIAMTDGDDSGASPGIFLLSTETGEKRRVTAPTAGDEILRDGADYVAFPRIGHLELVGGCFRKVRRFR